MFWAVPGYLGKLFSREGRAEQDGRGEICFDWLTGLCSRCGQAVTASVLYWVSAERVNPTWQTGIRGQPKITSSNLVTGFSIFLGPRHPLAHQAQTCPPTCSSPSTGIPPLATTLWRVADFRSSGYSQFLPHCCSSGYWGDNRAQTQVRPSSAAVPPSRPKLLPSLRRKHSTAPVLGPCTVPIKFIEFCVFLFFGPTGCFKKKQANAVMTKS